MKSKYKNLTAEKIKEALDEIFTIKTVNVKERSFIMFFGCLSKPGQWVKRDPKSMSLNICDNLKCPSCSALNRALIDEMNNWKSNNGESIN